MQDINTPVLPDGNDSYEIHKKPQKFIYALNANIQNEDGNSLIIQNEHSNLLCSMFKPGYSVLHHQADRANDCMYFWLANEATGCSEIGRICHQAEYSVEDIEKNCNCNAYEVLNEPLEDTDQVPLCTYETLITDCCGDEPQPCLNFSKKFPIESEIKVEDGNIYIYWVDGNNPDRRINILDLDQYRYRKEPCSSEEPEFICLDCDKLRIDKLYSKPCLVAHSFEIGGNVAEGAYLAMIAYCDSIGNPMTRYMSQTNWIKVKNPQNKIYQPHELNRNSGYAIKFKVSDLDIKFSHYKIAIVANAEVDGKEGYYQLGAFPTTQDTAIFVGTKNLKRITIDEITAVSKIYDNSKYIKSANNFLLRGGLKADADINLQPIVNLLGQFLKYRTAMANDDLYNGVNTGIYEQYMRDEVHPYSIRFHDDRGYFTPLFPLIGRKAETFNLDGRILNEDDYINVIGEDDKHYEYLTLNEYRTSCDTSDRNKWWQYYNTAEIEDVDFRDEPYNCGVNLPEPESEEITIERYVVANGEHDIPNTLDIVLEDGVSIKKGYDFIDLEYFWSINGDDVLGGVLTDAFDIKGVVDPISPNYIIPPTTLEVDEAFPDSCSPNTTPISYEVYISDKGSIISGSIEKDFKPLSEYKIPSFSGFCSTRKSSTNPEGHKYEVDKDASDILYLSDTVINLPLPFPPSSNSTTCSLGSESLIDRGEIVFKNQIGYKLNCSQANSIPINDNSSDLWLSFFVPHDVQDTTTNSTYQNTDYVSAPATVSYTPVPLSSPSVTNATNTAVFTDNLHTNAVWYKVQNIDSDSLTILISKSSGCDEPRDKGLEFTDWVRISIYDDCNGGASGGNLVYSAIYNKTLAHKVQLSYNDATIPLVLPIASGAKYKTLEVKTYYIAFDTPIVDIFKVERIYANNDGVGSNDCDHYVAMQGKVLSGTCDCMELKIQETDVLEERFKIQDAKVKVKYKYSAQCIRYKYANIACAPFANSQIRPAYWESTLKYPCNEELWDSSKLNVDPNKIPTQYQDEFERIFTNNGNVDANGFYVLDVNSTNFQDKPIRHFKAPDNRTAPLQDGEGKYFGAQNLIFPLGIWIDNEIINALLDVAVDSELITQEFRNRIKGYEIYRGDRRMNKSIIAKGIGMDMLQYDRGGETWQTQNYPFNDLRKDVLHTGTVIPKKGASGEYGNALTLISPDTFWQRPTLNINSELKLEGFLYGETKSRFVDVEDYPKMTILNQSAFTIAEALAWAEVALNSFLAVSDVLSRDNEVYRVDGGFVFSLNPVGIAFRTANQIATIVNLALNAPYNAAKIKSQWVQIFYNNGTPQNLASMYVGECRYENYAGLDQYADKSLRPIMHNFYMGGKNYEVNGLGFQDIRIYNSERESVPYLNLGQSRTSSGTIDLYLDYDNATNGVNSSYDESRFYASDVGACDGILSKEIRGRNAMSPYISVKNYIPDQYGGIDSNIWFPTGYCGNLSQDNKCHVIFGGDTYISRFSFKRKYKFFDTDILGAPSLTAFSHSEYSSIDKPRFFVDYNNQMNDNLLFAPATTIKSSYVLDCDTNNGFYKDGKSKFYLYYFGYVNFLVESEINCNYRYGQNELEKNYYENAGDIAKWSQPKHVPFAVDNWSGGYWEEAFSIDRQIIDYYYLKQSYNRRQSEADSNYYDRAIVSLQDNQEKGIIDPWIVFRLRDYHDFGKKYGTFYGFQPMSDMRVMGRFENGYVIFNAYSTIQGTIENFQLGNGSIFSTKPTLVHETNLGYGGTQHRAICNTPFGNFWVDAKRGHVHFIQNGSFNSEEISAIDARNWFQQNLPFQILKDFPNIPDSAIDNTLLGLGITMAYDARYQRVFITKRDARIKPQYKANTVWNSDINGFEYTQNPTSPTPTVIEIFPNDPTYFEDYSWTRAYSPPLKAWLSFYSFKPDYYIEQYNYFQSGFSDGGLWSHLITNKSYQVYYGTRYPFKLITSLEEKFFNRILSHYDYWLDVRRYHDEIDYASLQDRNMDYACVFNRDSNSGKLTLINRQENNFAQDFIYPKYNSDNVEILSSWTENKWSINTLYDLIKNKNSNVPIWLNAKGQDDKELNPLVFDYTKKSHNYLKGDVFNFLLVQEKESRLKYIVRIVSLNNKPYI